jgi:hypothetical protein
MPSPFPGMDPFLEAPELWPEVHSRLIVALADSIAPALMPEYYVAIEKRTYFDTPEDSVLIGIPDVTVLGSPATSDTPQPEVQASVTTAIKPGQPQTVTLPLPEEIQERYLEIRETATNKVITLIEVLSPKNKRSGEGRDAYLRKRQQVLTSASHLVEIDLLRQGTPMPVEGAISQGNYRILISDRTRRPQALLYAFTLRDAIPRFTLPLKPGAPEVTIDLKALLDGIYDRAGYSIRIKYDTSTLPALSSETRQWLQSVLTHQNP